MECTDLFFVALAAAKHQPCSAAISDCTGGYQTLVVESEIVAGKFVSTCLKALTCHSAALEMYTVQEYEAALELFQSVKESAAAMEQLAGSLEDQTSTLIDKTHVAWVASATDKAAVHDAKLKFEKNKAAEQIEKRVLEEKKAAEEKLIKDSMAVVKAATSEDLGEDDSSDMQAAAAGLGVATGVLAVACPPAAIVTGIGAAAVGVGAVIYSSNKAEERLQREKIKKEKVLAAKEILARRQEQAAETKANLTRTMGKLQQALTGDDQMETAERGLELCWRTLAQIKTNFSQLKLFWAFVRQQCDSIATDPKMQKTLEVLAKTDAADENAEENSNYVQELRQKFY